MPEIVYNLCDSAMFCALHDQLASLGRHAQLTRCFSAVAELLVVTDNVGLVVADTVVGLYGSIFIRLAIVASQICEV